MVNHISTSIHFLLLAAAFYLNVGLCGNIVANSAMAPDVEEVSGTMVSPADLQLGQPFPSRSFSHTYNGPVTSSATDHLDKGSVVLKTDLRKWRTASCHLILLSRKVLATLKRCNLLFPYHSFW